MKKILLVAFREIKQRIKNKTFLLTTLLLPIGIIVFYGAMIVYSSKDTENYNISIISSDTTAISEYFKSDDKYNITINTTDTKSESDAVILFGDISQDTVNFDINYTKKIGLLTKNEINDNLREYIRYKRIIGMGVDVASLQRVNSNININYHNKSGSEDNNLKEKLSYVIGFGLGIFMYVILTIYGAQVMRGIMEEKINRIAEVIISSMTPFQLMMGKILGIAAVSFIQLSLWGIIIMVINITIAGVMGLNGDIPTNGGSSQMGEAIKLLNSPEFKDTLQSLSTINFKLLLSVFLFYFLSGFLLYASLFAIVGSSVNDDPQDVQALMMPIMMPIFFSFILLTKSINNPVSTEAIWGSIVPFTSPVVMLSRLVFGLGDTVKYWELIVSMMTITLSSILFIYIASRIYRIAILNYGKKTNWKQIITWIFNKN